MTQGDGPPVIVFPGLATNDIATALLRKALVAHGFNSYPWGQGFNCGPRQGVIEECMNLVWRLKNTTGEQVSLIGWSLGGLYAREVAKLMAKEVRCVITLGSPFSGTKVAPHVRWLYEVLSKDAPQANTMAWQLPQPPPVPTTSIYSKSDKVVHWQSSLNAPGERLENIEVDTSHFGLVLNSAVVHAVVDRLKQDPAKWSCYKKPPRVNASNSN